MAPCELLPDLVADILDGLADLPASLAKSLLDLPGVLLSLAFVAKLLVVAHLADRFLDLTLDLVGLALYLVLVPHGSSSCRCAR